MKYEMSILERMAVFLRAIRQIGDNVLREENHIFAFPTIPLASGRDLAGPMNYDLVEVIGNGNDCRSDDFCYIIDPRAGRGPWISGTKTDSMVGAATRFFEKTFFSPFRKFPAPGQTMEAVVLGQREYIRKLQATLSSHSKVVIGNCSAGWLLELIAADRDLFFPDDIIITNGSPRSYWYDTNNYLYSKGRFFGGEWIVRYLCDLAGGYFDGAYLSQNFEEQDWLKVVFEKYTQLLLNPTSQAIDRSLQDEKWWTYFTFFSKEEMLWIMQNLFIGNRLERGRACLNDQPLDPRKMRATRLIFCSKGDGITSTAQALGFIPQSYKSADEMKEIGAKIIYCVDEACGHLAIFVSREIARRYHMNFFRYRDRIRELPPGLWQMMISEDGHVRFEERNMSDIISLLPQNHRQQYREGKVFSDLSERLGQLYECTIGSSIKVCGKLSQPFLHEFLENCHPMRSTRTIFSSINPIMNFIAVTFPMTPAEIKREPKNMDTSTILTNLTIDSALNLMRASADFYLNGWRSTLDFWTTPALKKRTKMQFPARRCAGCPDKDEQYWVCGTCPDF